MQHVQKILKKVEKLNLSTKQIVDGLVSGNHTSIFKGQGIEFSEIRDYRFGDDVRSIDWNVTARFNRPYIKEFIEERDLQIYFIIDMSGSSSFGTNISKKQKSFEIIASLMFAALKDNDGVGVFLITDKIEKFIPAKKGRTHILRLLGEISEFTPKSIKTNLQNSLDHVSKTIKRKSLVFVISDFIDKSEFLKPFTIMRKKHDIIALKIIDQREQEIPNVGLIELEDAETGEQILVDTSDEEFRSSFAKLITKDEQNLVSNFRKIKINIIPLLTEQNYSMTLNKFFKKRRYR